MSKLKIVWTKHAHLQRRSLLAARADFAGMDSALKADAQIIKLLTLAAVQPDMGKPGLVKGTRELYPLRYRLVYRISQEEKKLYVVALLSQWQLWPFEADHFDA